MALQDLLIKIGASAKGFNEELDKIEKKTDDLQGHLGTLNKVSAVGFAALVGTIGLTVRAFGEAEQVTLKQNAILKATGGIAGITSQELNKMATALQDQTSFGDEAVKSGQNMLLTFTRIGKDVFPQATQAVLDLATKMGGDTVGAASALGKALQDPTEGISRLRREGITFTKEQEAQIFVMQKTGQTAAAQKIILDELSSRIGGLAQASAQGTGQFKALGEVFGDIAENVGGQFAPALSSGAKQLREFLIGIRDNEGAAGTFAAILAGLTGTFGTLLVVGTATALFIKFKAALEAANIAIGATRLAVIGLTAATGIGLLITGLSLVYVHWNTVWPAITGIVKGSVELITRLLSGLGTTLKGAFTVDTAKIKEGLTEIKRAFTDTDFSITPKISLADAKRGDDAALSKARDDRQAKSNADRERAQQAHEDELGKIEIRSLTARNTASLLEIEGHTAELVALKTREADLLKVLADEKFQGDKGVVRARLKEIQALYTEASGFEAARLAENNELTELQLTDHSSVVIELKQKQIEDLATLADQDFKGSRELLQLHLAEVTAQYEQAHADEIEQRKLFDEEILANTDAFNGIAEERQTLFLARHRNELQKELLTEKTEREKAAKDKLAKQISEDNKYLENTRKFGKVYAEIYQLMHSEIIQGFASAAQELSKLQNSNNSALKAAAKPFAIANIIMQTAQSAMLIFEGFQGLPFGIGIPLGIAAAGLAVAYGAEQISRVTSAQTGGLVGGGIPGRDSSLLFAEPGELVVPVRNFDEVVNATASARGLRPLGEPEREASSAAPEVLVRIDMAPGVERYITAQQVEARALGNYRSRR